MKNLITLIKLQKTKVDEQRLLLLKLQEKLDAIMIELETLAEEKRLQEDLLHKEPDLGLTYADYLETYLHKKDFLEKKRSSTDYAVELARDQLAGLFEEQKRYEIAKQNRLDEMKQEELRKDRIELDEIGSVGFLRNKKEQRRK